MLNHRLKSLRLCIACLFLFLPLTAASPRAKGQAMAEKIISSNPDLQALDVHLNQKYKELMQSSFNPILLRSEQRQWLRLRRNQCQDAASLKSVYVSRLDKFKTWEKYSRVAGPGLDHLSFYEGEPPEELLTDRFLGGEIKRMVGQHLQTLETNLSTSGGAELVNDGSLVADGCAPHACVVAEARMIIRRNGKIEILIWDSGKAMYFANKEEGGSPSREVEQFLKTLGNPKLIPMASQSR